MKHRFSFLGAHPGARTAADPGAGRSRLFSDNWRPLQGLAHTALVLAMVALAWLRPKRIFATEDGLAVGFGKRTRLIPWSRVQDIRELPWIRFNPPWYPKMWQLDLDNECFDFCGVRNARQIVIEFVARAGDRSSGV